MKIIIAPDSFKGSLTANKVADAIEVGVRKAGWSADVVKIPLADGGEGTMDCLDTATAGSIREVEAVNPIGVPILASYGQLGDKNTCVIEMAVSSGLYLIEKQDRNPMKTTTYGVGQLIKSALENGCKRFIIGLGGSATNDGGAGMLQALGVKLLDQAGNELAYGGGDLGQLHKIMLEGMDARLQDCEFIIASDVDNPFVGENGASVVFGPQKGASPNMVEELDQSLTHFANLIHEKLGVRIHDMAGAGAAGGLAGALFAFMGGKIVSGFQVIAEQVNLEEHIRGASLVITGEGQTDFQTAFGKTPCGVARIAKAYDVPAIVLSGSLGNGIETLHEEGITAVFSIMNRPMELEEAMQRTPELLEQASEQLIRLFTV